MYAPGDAAEQAWAFRALVDLRVGQARGLDDLVALLAGRRRSSQHYAWLHAEAWLLFRQGRYGDAAAVLEQLVSGRLHHTAWPWAMFHDDLGDSYAALGRGDEARRQWRRALAMSADPKVRANPEGIPWDRAAVEAKLARSAVRTAR
jgi:tetratricopeptide (TPR) repeat protein